MKRLLFVLMLTGGAAAADVDLFQSPSGNIVCWARFESGLQNIICTIKDRSGAPAMATLAGCTDAHSFEMDGTGPVTSFCGAALRSGGPYPAVPYGATHTTGLFTCRSETTGFGCTNSDGHGFFLSRRAQQVY